MDLPTLQTEDRHLFHIAALTRLTLLGLRLADSIAEAIDAEANATPPAEPAPAETASETPANPAKPRPATRNTERYWQAFNRIAAGIRANIALEKKLTPPQPAPLPPADTAPQASPAAPAATGVPFYLQNDPAHDDNDLARLGRNWKTTLESDKFPFQPQAPTPLPLPRPRLR